MKRYAFIMVVIYSLAGALHAHDGQMRQADAREQCMDIDALLDDARESGIGEEVIKVKEVPVWEFWLRRVGGSLLMSILAAKDYIKSFG